MKKINICNLLLIIAFNICVGQTTDPFIKTDLPIILPPSPTVAALMKFEEVSMSNYTGYPNISIPLFSTSTLSKDISIDISLKYNPASAAADERSSDVGLGWSLFAGGTVSRTVRGIPDEYNTFDFKGVYYDNYYEFMKILANGIHNYDEEYLAEEFQFEANEKGRYDTEHDLWQYNFMGKSGRFYIKKNTSSGILEVVKLDDNIVKIVNVYDTTTTYQYKPIRFDIYDDKGYKYVFDVTEITNQNTYTEEEHYGASAACELVPTFLKSNAGPTKTFKSAFHLSKVYDNNDKLLIELLYNNDNNIYKEIVIDETLQHARLSNVNELPFYQYLATRACGNATPPQCQDQFNAMQRGMPKITLSKSQRSTNVKKLTRININGIAQIHFKFTKGRPDENLHLADSSYAFRQMVVSNWIGDSIKKFTMVHSNYKTIYRRMQLSQVIESNFVDSKTMVYNLSYKENNSELRVSKDSWGYFNLIPPGYTRSDESFKNVNPTFCYTEVLQKIGLPTGGCQVFQYESNSYTYEGNNAVTNFDENPNNWEHVTDNPLVPYSLDNSHLGPISIANPSTTNQKITIYPTTSGLGEGAFLILKKNGSAVPGYTNISCPDILPDCGLEYTLEAGATYEFVLSIVDTVTVSADIVIVRHNKKSSIEEWLYGGGFRIKRIGYFDEDISQEDYFNNTVSPKKEMNYRYNFFGTIISSGSLVFPKPLFNYYVTRNTDDFDCGGLLLNSPLIYDVQTYFNNYSAIKTKGSDIGYQNVTVFENGNGKKEYTYKSPIDVPESDFSFTLQPPFLPSENFDYKRGLLACEKTFDETSRKLNETIFDYDYIETIETTGLKLYTTTYCGDLGRLANYDQFLYCSQHPGDCYSFMYPICTTGAAPSNFIGNKEVYEAVGWAKLKTKTTKNYFYPSGSSTANIVEADETYKYNSLNKKIRESSTTNSKGGLMRTKYFYHSGDATTRNWISEIEQIETYKDSTLLSTSKIIYDNAFAGNVAYLPKTIQTAKEAQTLEPRVQYNAYDDYGHPLEVQQENGTVVSYIWGYNKSQPIAKIENASNAAIATVLGVSLSTVDESDLTAINNLRTTLPTAMVTTYTYIPLVGVSTITDPRGYVTTYEYDSFGSLSVVKDHAGNKLSENQYNYRTQN